MRFVDCLSGSLSRLLLFLALSLSVARLVAHTQTRALSLTPASRARATCQRTALAGNVEVAARVLGERRVERAQRVRVGLPLFAHATRAGGWVGGWIFYV